MTVPKTVPAAEAGYSGCSINARCFYEGSRKEGICVSESLCARDLEVRRGRDYLLIRSSPIESIELDGIDDSVEVD